MWTFYKKHGRHDLPWRETQDLYKILVSEVMLQQTQVDRVVPFYTSFIKRFPTARSLASAPLSDVLKAWQGLGYNRRAKLLQAAAKHLSDVHVLAYRSKYERLEELPGVGPYTACAVAAFAYNQDVVVIETNIRTAIIHHFFADRKQKVSDREIAEVLRRTLSKGRAREWYSALMDYGAHLKRSGVSHNARVSGYVKQSKFAGSLRQARGAILRALTEKSTPSMTRSDLKDLSQRSGLVMQKLNRALADLVKEKLVQKKGARYALAD